MYVIDEKSFAFEFLCIYCAARFANATVAPNDKKVKTPAYRAPPDLPDFLILIISTSYNPIFIKLSILFTLALFYSSSSKFPVDFDPYRSSNSTPKYISFYHCFINNNEKIHWILFFIEIVRVKRNVSPSCCGYIQPVRNLKPSHDNLFFRTRRNPSSACELEEHRKDQTNDVTLHC